MKNTLYLISNEKIYQNNGMFFCDNLDMKSTPEGLNNYFEVKVIARKSKVSRSQNIYLKTIKTFSNIFSFILEVFKSTKNKNSQFLIVSLTPYTFFAGISLFICGKKPFLYLRSNGYEEYKIILGTFGKFIYHLMFILIARFSNLISCREYILMGKKGYVVSPSQLDSTWLQNHVEPTVSKIKLIYVGRIKKEKGVFSLLSLLKTQTKINLTIVGAGEEDANVISQSNVNVIRIVKDKKELIKLYDNHNITILPSFTEGYPMVILESLSRLRPVIVFKDIEHVVENLNGVFVSNRDYPSLLEKINYVMNNYNSIQKSMETNKLPDNESFINQLKEILSKNKFDINNSIS